MTTNPIKSVLIVDDSRVARMLIRNILLSIHPHWIISEAASGKEAIELANRETPNYITMDYNMPEMNGIEASQHILQHAPKTLIALFTANVQEQTRKQAEELGVGFVGKPITESTIKQALAFFSDRS
jgi:CheY-like chemotaxis protein